MVLPHGLRLVLELSVGGGDLLVEKGESRSTSGLAASGTDVRPLPTSGQSIVTAPTPASSTEPASVAEA
ncbi:hypothetical protein [Streptomyces sp. ME18-1-4]|uniref:hypothetical protein n=1 Tax=Streptomyces sp. ME18-1-4 TaxID=3028685 RepID=UPI0029AE9D6C|nr:hypothetical protein [Streptomyces sp. ME18-1-4]MDX3246447.1 hypothetical protein [Streptomyces sp. ME18-1-4]